MERKEAEEDDGEDALDSDPYHPSRSGDVSPTIPSFNINNFEPVVRQPALKGLLRSPVSAGTLGMFGGRGSPFNGMSLFFYYLFYSQN